MGLSLTPTPNNAHPKQDVRAGNFMIHESQRQRVARGKNLGVARAQNKGGVGLAFRYHDMTVGVVCAHLASDSTGRCVVSDALCLLLIPG